MRRVMGAPPTGQSVEVLERGIRKCRNCALSGRCRNPVVGVGPVPCDILLLGEAPDGEADVAGQPFAGRAEQVLLAFMEAAEVSPTSVRIAQAVRCRPTEGASNRTPTALELQACRPWLELEIKVVRPRVIVALGETALNAVIVREGKAKDAQIAYSIGRCYDGLGGTVVIPCWHPVFYLRSATQLIREDFTAALQKAVRIVQTKPYGG